MPTNSDTPRPKFQYSIRTLLLVTACIAIFFSTYRTGGPVALKSVLVYSTLVGFVFLLVTRRWLGRYCLAVLGGAIIGGAFAVDLVVCQAAAILNRPRQWDAVELLFPGQSRGGPDLVAFALLGALIGGVASIGFAIAVRCWLAYRNHRNSRSVEAAQEAAGKDGKGSSER
jgi:hypothetical protein